MGTISDQKRYLLVVELPATPATRQRASLFGPLQPDPDSTTRQTSFSFSPDGRLACVTPGPTPDDPVVRRWITSTTSRAKWSPPEQAPSWTGTVLPFGFDKWVAGPDEWLARVSAPGRGHSRFRQHPLVFHRGSQLARLRSRAALEPQWHARQRIPPGRPDLLAQAPTASFSGGPR